MNQLTLKTLVPRNTLTFSPQMIVLSKVFDVETCDFSKWIDELGFTSLQQYFETMERWTWKALCNEAPFRFGKNLASSGIEPATPWSEVGSANRSATRTPLIFSKWRYTIISSIDYIILSSNFISCEIWQKIKFIMWCPIQKTVMRVHKNKIYSTFIKLH